MLLTFTSASRTSMPSPPSMVLGTSPSTSCRRIQKPTRVQRISSRRVDVFEPIRAEVDSTKKAGDYDHDVCYFLNDTNSRVFFFVFGSNVHEWKKEGGERGKNKNITRICKRCASLPPAAFSPSSLLSA